VIDPADCSGSLAASSVFVIWFAVDPSSTVTPAFVSSVGASFVFSSSGGVEPVFWFPMSSLVAIVTL
jgi:hypothetical protein